MAAACGYGGRRGGAWADLWPEFLAQLGQSIGADGIRLAALPADGRAQHWQWRQAPDLPAATDLLRMRLDRVYSQVDMPGAAADSPPLRALRSAMPAGGSAVIVATRQGRDFRAVDGARLSGLGRFLAQALANWQALAAERQVAALEGLASEAQGLGWMVLSPAGRVLATSPWLVDRLVDGAPIRLRADGLLSFGDADLGAGFARAMVQVGKTGGAARITSATSPLRLMLQPGDHLGTPALRLWLRWPKPLRDLAPETLADAFQISRSEARLAARLANGFSLEAAAADLGWTMETTRSTSKQLFARLSAHGQPSLLRELLLTPLP